MQAHKHNFGVNRHSTLYKSTCHTRAHIVLPTYTTFNKNHKKITSFPTILLFTSLIKTFVPSTQTQFSIENPTTKWNLTNNIYFGRFYLEFTENGWWDL